MDEGYTGNFLQKGKGAYAQTHYHVLEHSELKVGGNEIAEAKEKAGLALGEAYNRLGPMQRSSHSPRSSISATYAAFKYFSMM